MANHYAALNDVFRALADPTRRAVVARLSRGPASVSELAAPFDMALPSFVQHLQVLEEGGLIRSNKVGRVRTCRIEARRLATAERWLTERRALWERRLDALERHLDRSADRVSTKTGGQHAKR